MKKIKLFNGRVFKGHFSHAYVGAYSQKHAIELVKKCSYDMSQHEMNEYWSKGRWANLMDNIEPQVGVWIHEDNFNSPATPVKRLI